MNKDLPFIRRILSDSQYDWMLNHFPFRIMYTHKQIDSQHKMWLPRWGWSSKQIDEAGKRAEELRRGIKWD